MTGLDFPGWIRITHLVNLILITFLIRSGMEILATHPKLYWNDDSKPGSEWSRFTRKVMPRDRLWDALDEEEDYSSLVALPGHENLGLGRHWHFISVIAWILTGVFYVLMLFVTGQYHRFVPYSWEIFPEAWNDILTYMSFNLPPLMPGETYDAIQKLAYGSVVFILAPFQIATGAAQSPAIEARFPWYVRLWGGRQWARSLHFFGLLAFVVFIIIHLTMISIWGFGELTSLMIWGSVEHQAWSTVIVLFAIFCIVLMHIAATKLSLAYPRRTQQILGFVVNNARRLLLHRLTSHQEYSKAEITPQHRVNGKPPSDDSYKILAAHRFAGWRLEIGGLVENPMTFTLEDLKTFPTRQSQRVMHNCIQGWTSIAEWTGVPMRQIVELVRPHPEARYVYFHSMQDVGRDEPAKMYNPGYFYEVIDLELARHPQTILAYEMNGEPLPIEHGAPLRLRIETSVGFKMVKWIDRIEFIDEYRDIGYGMGGYREDNVYYDKEGEI
ncbi:molybdopterin-dependent oxidoreductase [Rubrobacter calidifluminis]|uniref:molybdopterin-dependent oxidoreductase n=1 Tax=Rubrobacter calidifluminis TaxID=1392640 RepID=UPI0023622514|nr:molybdopterin-dependent oxidoreductase [Rubrobacter calidifluminis]